MQSKPRKRRFFRTPRIQRLENRYLLAATPFGQNPLGPLDVSRDGIVTALDALQIINALGRQDGFIADPSLSPGRFIDVNGNGEGTALDALQVINALGRGVPVLVATLPNDSAPTNRPDLSFDLRTNVYDIDLHLSIGEIGSQAIEFRVGQSGPFTDLAERFLDGRASLSMADIDNLAGGPLADGDHRIEARLGGEQESVQFVLTVDRQSPEAHVDFENPIRVAPTQLSIGFGEPVVVASDDTDRLAVSFAEAPPIAPRGLESIGNTVLFELPEPLEDGQFDLSLAAGIQDLAGNRSPPFATQFVVADPTGIASVSPASGERMVSIAREVIIRFDESIDPATIDPDPTNPDDDTIVVIAGGQRVPGRIRVSSTERVVTFFYDNPLPASTEVRVQVAGDRIRGRDGLALDAESDNQPGGTRAFEFRTLPLTRIPGTELFGFVRDSLTQEPLEGVTISLDAHPHVRATTDTNGFFELGVEDTNGDGISDGLPAPDFFVHIDGSGAVSPDGSIHASLGKPFHSVPGQRIQLNMAGDPFDIFLPRIASDASVTITPGQETVFGFGNSDLQLLSGMFPDADQAMLSSMQVTIPAGSALNDFGEPASSAFVVPVDPDFLPAPLPPGLDPSLVVSIQTPGATNFDVPASVTFPNLDGLAPGEKTLLFSFDHDAGKFVVNGTATVSEDGMRVVSDPETGINAPGWHFIFDLIQFFASGSGLGNGGGCVGFFCEPTGDDEVATFELGVIAQGRSASFDAGVEFEINIPGLFKFEHEPDAEIPPQTFGPRFLLDRTFTVDSDGIFARVLRRFTGSLDFLVFDAKLKGFVGVSASSGGISIKQGDTHFSVELPSASFINATASVTLGGAACRAGASVMPGLSLLCGRGIDIEVGKFPPELDVLGLLEFPLPDEDGDGNPDPASKDFEGTATFTSGVFVEVDFGSLEVTGFLRETTGSQGDSLLVLGPVETNLESNHAEEEQIVEPYSTVKVIGDDPRGYYRIFLANGAEIFGQTLDDGSFETQLPPDTNFTTFIYHPATNTSSVQTGRTSNAGSTLTISGAREYFGGVDTDGDGIPDVGEVTIGTSPDNIDTDEDGISDAAEIAQGLDPLANRGFPTGVIASLPLSAPARKIVLAGSAEDTSRQTAYVAIGAGGLAIVDTSQFDNPVVLGQLDLDGEASDVTVDPRAGRAAVATGLGGLHLVDVSDPMLPRLVRIVEGEFQQVESRGGILYTANEQTITAIDFESGQVITSLPLGGEGEIVRLVLNDQTLYVLDDQQQLTIVTIDDQQLVKQGSLLMFGLSGDLFVADDIAYITDQDNEGRGGYRTIDVSDPAQPALIRGIDVPEQGAPSTAMVTNGSGTGLLVGTLDRVVNRPSVLTLLDVSDSTHTFDRIGQFLLPAVPHDVAVASGIAYVASDVGLQVINYLPFDNQLNPPTVALSVDDVGLDADPEAVGLQLLEGVRFPVTAEVSDDVQVRNVELLLDGQIIDNAVSFPFDLSAFAPVLPESESISEHRLQLRATDTGGNVAASQPLMFQVVSDLIVPTIDRFDSDLLDIDLTREGDQALEAQTLTLRYDASDTGGIERIELLENGERLRTIDQPTGVLAYTTPLLQSAESIASIDLVLRAFDFAGNVSQSAPLSFEIVADTFGPQIVEATLNPAGVRIQFDEPLAAAVRSSDSFEVRGPENQILPIDDLLLLNDDHVVLLRFDVSRLGSYTVTIAATEVTDRQGNLLGQEPVVLTLQATDRSPYPFPNPKLLVGDGPLSLRRADLNHDNLPDLLTVNRDSGDLSLLLATAGGKYEPEARVAVGSNPADAVAIDVNGDQLTDLAIVFPDTDELQIFLQDAGGSFTESRTVTVGDRPIQVDSHDFNSDGIIDLITSNESSDDASVLIGLPNGEFADPIAIEFGSSFRLGTLRLADFNGDGITDLGAAGFNALVVRMGDGAGMFQAPRTTTIAGNAEHMVTGDFNGDGNLDVALSQREVSLLFGDGQGGFFGQQTIFSDNNATDAIASLDFDEDGNVDLAITVFGDERLLILRNLGNGEFNEHRRITLSDRASFSVVAEDLDLDGKVDLAVANSSSDDVLLVFDIAGSSAPNPIRIDIPNGPGSVVTADFNGDQQPDIVAAYRFTGIGGSTTGGISISLGTLDGFAEPQILYGDGGGPTSVRAADVNGDGFLDIVATLPNVDDIVVLLGNGNGTFGNPIRFDSEVTRPPVVVIADFNQDQILDLAVRAFAGTQLAIFDGVGDGTFTFARRVFLTFSDILGNLESDSMLTTGDFNDDGFVDLATVYRGDADVAILLGNGTGEFGEPILVATVDSPVTLATDDYNADGILDLAVANQPGEISVLLGQGNASFTENQRIDIGTGTQSMIAVDLNLDGKLDLVAVNRTSNDVAVLLGAGDGSFGTQMRFGAGQYPFSIIADDLNADGLIDLLTANLFSDDLTLLLNQSDIVFTNPNLGN